MDVLLESAAFSNGHISRTSRNLQLFSEAAMRYERIVDPQGCPAAADVAAALFAEVCGATVCSGRVDVYPAPADARDPAAALRAPARHDGRPHQRRVRRPRPRAGSAASVRARVPPSPTPSRSTRPDLPPRPVARDRPVRGGRAPVGRGLDVEPTIPAARNHAGGLTARAGAARAGSARRCAPADSTRRSATRSSPRTTWSACACPRRGAASRCAS